MAPLRLSLLDFVWKFSLQATPVDLLFFLVATLFLGLGRALPRSPRIRSATRRCPFRAPGSSCRSCLAILFGIICLFCLPMLALTLPVLVYLGSAPAPELVLPPHLRAIVGFAHDRCRGSITGIAPAGTRWGRTFTWGLYGQGEYIGNQIFCNPTIPELRLALRREHDQGIHRVSLVLPARLDLLGSNPLVLLFAASILHQFRRPRVQAFRWLVVGSAFALVAMSSLADAKPDPTGPWNLCGRAAARDDPGRRRVLFYHAGPAGHATAAAEHHHRGRDHAGRSASRRCC